MIVALVFVIFVFVKFKYIKHKLTWIIVLFLVLLFYIGFLASTSGKSIDFSTFEGSQAGIKLYLTWLGQSFDNMKTLTGHAIKLDWGGNATAIKNRLTPNG